MAASKESKIIIDPKKDEFKVYLEKTGISDQLAKILISLYEEPNKPENADDFISRNFGKKENIETIYLKNEVLRLRETIDKQNTEIEKYKKQLQKAIKEIGDAGFLDEEQ